MRLGPFTRATVFGINLNSLSPAIPVAVFALTLIWRAPNLLIHPRFWAEEGSLYYANLQNTSFWKGLITVFNGNYQLFTNVIVELALRVPIRYAPTITTYASLTLALACAWMITSKMLTQGSSPLIASAGSAVFALQPAGYEVFLNATNAQWVTSVLGLLLCLSNEQPAFGVKAVLGYAVLALCGLTGTTTCILLPLFILNAIWKRTLFRWMMVAVLGVITVLQACIVITHLAEMHRVFAISDQTILALVFQVIFAEFLPGDALDRFGVMLANNTEVGAVRLVQWSITVIGLGGIAFIGYFAARCFGVYSACILLAGVVFAPLVNEFGSQTPADQMFSASVGGRYFFIGASSMLVLLVATIGQTAVAGTVLVALVAINGVLTARHSEWPRSMMTGPSFSEQLDACKGLARCEIRVWPNFYNPTLAISMPLSK